MLDTVSLQKNGIPTVTLAYDTFEHEARMIARMFKMQDVPLVVIKHWEAGYTPETARQEMDNKTDTILGNLIKPVAQKAE